MLSLVLPKGSLERATLDLFDAADLTVRRSSDRDYHASIDDPRIDKVRFLRPQEIPSYLERGLFRTPRPGGPPPTCQKASGSQRSSPP
jgi:ATP phosphoribosyltransferase